MNGLGRFDDRGRVLLPEFSVVLAVEHLGRKHERPFVRMERHDLARSVEKIGQVAPVLSPGTPCLTNAPQERRSLACTNIIENVMGTVRRVCRNVKYWRSPSMALRWAAAAMQEAVKGFRRLKAFKQLPALRAALDKTNSKAATAEPLAQIAEAA